MKNILIGGAWPYANGSLHIGHIAGLLPGDVLARYFRAKGDQVFYVSGSDCHGTPVTIRAKQEDRTPQEISDFYHNEFVSVFDALGFSHHFSSSETGVMLSSAVPVTVVRRSANVSGRAAPRRAPPGGIGGVG